MYEIVDNSIQLTVIFCCAAASIYRTALTRSRIWLLCSLFFASYFLGDLWWLLDELFYPEVSGYSLVPYINWKASILFLILMLQQDRNDRLFRKPESRAMWLIPVFCGIMCIFYMQFGAYIDNITTAILMSILIWEAVQRPLGAKNGTTEYAADHDMCRMILWFCVIEYIMWTITCLDYGHPLRSLYYICEAVITLLFILMIPAVGKAVGR